MNELEFNKIINELYEVEPELLDEKALMLYKAIMKIADQRDLYKQKIDLKISEYEEILDSPIIKEDYKLEVQHIGGIKRR
jgi:hypothetical protein